MPLKPRDVEDKLLTKFRFSYSEKSNQDHIWFELIIPGFPKISTKISHGETDITDPIIKLMARELSVNTGFFKEMIRCTKSRDDFLARIRSNPYPPTNRR